jgi:hypothetical protein
VIEFIDQTAEKDGTPINRKTMMAIQDFIAKITRFNDDGSITETNSEGQTKTIRFNDDGSITETFVGEKTIIKTITFEGDTVKEVIS